MLPLRIFRRVLTCASSNPGLRTDLKHLKPYPTVLQKYYSSQHIVNSPYSPMQFPEITIDNFILEQLDQWSDKTAIVCGISGRKYTYSQVKTYSKRVALGLLKSGLKPGQVITLILPNMPEFVIAVLGALRAGLVVSTVNPLYAAEEIRHQLNDSSSINVITIPQKLKEVNEAISKLTHKFLPTVVIHSPSDGLPEGTRSFNELLEMKNLDDSKLKEIKSNPDDTAFLLYSSGTTGMPKGVILTHKQIVSNIVQMSHPWIRLAYEPTDTYQDTIICILPYFHIYGLTACALSNLYAGSKLITLPKFEPQTFLNGLKETSIAYLVPPLIQFLGNHPSVTPNLLERLRSVVNGAAPISVSDAYKLLAKKHLLLTSGYGMTETSPVMTSCRNTCVDIGTVGSPVSNSKIKIINSDTGEIIDPKQPGEICIQGPQVMKGYLNNEKATASTLKDGWLHSGDVGYFDDKGHLYIVDRLKELIKVKGFQVAPVELEEILKTHPDVSDVAVVGKPDKRYGEVPVAFIVPVAGKSPSEKELKTLVDSKVAEYKQINSFIFTKSIPKSTTGKILRRTLRESLN